MALNLAPAGTHLLDTSAVIIMLRQRATAAPGAIVPFATLGELMIGLHRSVDHAKEQDWLLSVVGKAGVIYPTVGTVDVYAHITAMLQ